MQSKILILQTSNKLLQDSWRDLVNAFCNERVLLSLNAAHQVMDSNFNFSFLKFPEFGEKRGLS